MFHVKHSVFFTPRVPTRREQPRPTGARTPQAPEHREKPHNVQRATRAGAQRASVSRETLRLFHPAGAHSPQVAASRGCPSDMGMFHVKHSAPSGAVADSAHLDALTPGKRKSGVLNDGTAGASAVVQDAASRDPRREAALPGRLPPSSLRGSPGGLPGDPVRVSPAIKTALPA